MEGVKFSYGKELILNGVGFKLEMGEILGILGPNGSGKTTLLKCINKILEPSQGRILLDSENVLKMHARSVAKIMGYVPQNAVNEFSTPTVYEVVMMGRRPHTVGWQSSDTDDRIVWESLSELGVEGLASRMFNRLSSGQTQRVLLARALAQEADILLLDEPTSNLDVRYQLEVMDTILRLTKEKGVGVCTILHDIDVAMKYCDKVIILNDGLVIAAGDTQEVLTPSNIKKVYGIDVIVDDNYGRPRVIIL